MTAPARIVDAHVHLWDPARTDWYPYLGGGRELGMGDVSGMARRFDPATYAAEAGDWNVVKLVNVAAATGRHSVAETLELDRRAAAGDGPAAVVGGLPATESVAEAVGLIDEQMAAGRFRGVRPMAPGGPPVPHDDVLRALAERALVFELMAHPDQLADAARRLAAHPDLTVVVEHTGWPRSADAEERALWLGGIAALAAAGDHVHCKLSGLAMPLGSVDAEAFRPWLEPAIEAFGTERCLFASNFPVDGLHGPLDALWSAYATVAAGIDDDAVDGLFAANAERVYRC
ncbi:MAG: amidohydrolase family protein [Microthrixaceae bacterium]